MPRLGGVREYIPAWSHILEDAEPSEAFKASFGGAIPQGVMDACVNFAPTGQNRLAVRGGCAVKASLVDGSAHAMTTVLTIEKFSQVGAVLIAHDSVHSKHWAFLMSADLLTVVQVADMGWNTGTPHKPRVVELFEKIYIADATRDYSSRQQLISIDANGTVVAISADIGAGSQVLKPFAIGGHNNVLLGSGFDSVVTTGKNQPGLIWHSFLGVSPDAGGTGSWDKNAYNNLGARGEYITGICPGNQVTLVAKERELYRLTGFGSGVEGWQYAVQPINNQDFVGVKWPGALCYVEGHWYGVGEAGPWVTDGQEIASLVRPRRRSFKTATSFDKAFIRFIPDRRCVAFGILRTGETAVSNLWLWDVDEQTYRSDWFLPMTVIDIGAIPTGGGLGPTAAPGSITINDSLATLTSITGSLSSEGDTTADHQIWVDRGSGFVLDQVVLAGSTGPFTITGLNDSTAYNVKARNVKDGLYGVYSYSATTTGHTTLAAPYLAVEGGGENNTNGIVRVADFAAATLVVSRVGFGVVFTKNNPTPNTNYSFSDNGLTCNTTYTYTAVYTYTSWPAAEQTSTQASDTATTDLCGSGGHH